MSEHETPDDTKQHEQEEGGMQQHSSDSFWFLSFYLLRLFSISFLDNNVHLIRSRDHHTDIGSSRTGSLLLLAAPVPLHRGRPPLSRLSLVFDFSLVFFLPGFFV